MARANTIPGKVTPGVFDAVKVVLKCGGSIKEVAKFMKLSWDVVSLIDKSETIEEYRANMYERNQKKLEQKQVAAIKAKEQEAKQNEPVAKETTNVSQVVQVQLPYLLTQEIKRQNELLEGISRKLAYIVEDLCGGKVNAEQDH